MITDFLSEENIALHKEYVRQRRLKYSILEGSVPALCGASVGCVMRLRLDRRDRADALSLLPEIVLHDIFFSSFSDVGYPRSPLLASEYGSEAAYLDGLYRLCINSTHGFLVIEKGGGASVVCDYPSAFRYADPVLALDLCEHAYFLDYGFDRERYLVSALSYFDLTKI